MPARDWSAFALLLIDVQEDFWTDEVAAAAPQFREHVAELLATCRSEGIECVFRARCRRLEVERRKPIDAAQIQMGMGTLPQRV